MSHTLYDQMRASQNPFNVGFFRSIATSDELFSIMPFRAEGGSAWSYEREVSVGSFGFIAPGGTVSASNGTTERIEIQKREATSDFVIDNFVIDNPGNSGVDPVARQQLMKAKAAGRALAGNVINGGAVNAATVGPELSAAVTLAAASPFVSDRAEGGDISYTHATTTWSFRAPGDRDFGPEVVSASDNAALTLYGASPSKWIRISTTAASATEDAVARVTFSVSGNEFSGLGALISPAQTIAKSGAVLDFAMLDELNDKVKDRSGRQAYIVSSPMRRRINTLIRAAGLSDTNLVLGDGLSAPSFNGIPILVNDYITNDGTAGRESIYRVNLELDRGVWMGAMGSDPMTVEGDPRDTVVMGFRMREVGQVSNRSQSQYRLSWYGALALGSDLSAARLFDVKVAAS